MLSLILFKKILSSRPLDIAIVTDVLSISPAILRGQNRYLKINKAASKNCIWQQWSSVDRKKETKKKKRKLQLQIAPQTLNSHFRLYDRHYDSPKVSAKNDERWTKADRTIIQGF